MLFMWGSYCNFRFQILEISSLLYCSKCWRQTHRIQRPKNINSGGCEYLTVLTRNVPSVCLDPSVSGRCDSGDSPLKSTDFEYQFEIRSWNSKLWALSGYSPCSDQRPAAAACEAEDVGGVVHPVGGRGHRPRLHLRTGLPPAHLPRQQGRRGRWSIR